MADHVAAAPARKKLIEVSIPLEAINKASVREKSIRHGHPSTLHLWGARRPWAAGRAVLFAQLVDDPSAWPDRFPTEAAVERERARLHKVIVDLVPWEASNDEAILQAARWEIARSVAWSRDEEPPGRDDAAGTLRYLQEHAPPVYDPFSGGGSIPLEAQRLGLRAYGSDLNPVAVLIGKALVEIPPRFAGWAPVNPRAIAALPAGGWRGAAGLAEDVRYYGQWMRDEAKKRIGQFYPKATLLDGSQATVIAWLWARTVRSPDPAAKGAMVPLVSSFMLSTKEGKKAWVEPVISATSPDGWHFEVKTGTLSKVDEERLKKGTKTTKGNFACILTGAVLSEEYNRAQGKAKQIGTRLMAIVAEGERKRIYSSPTSEHEKIAAEAHPAWEPEGDLYEKALGVRVPGYGLTRWADLFTPRQLLALTTFSDLVTEARIKILDDARAAGLSEDQSEHLHAGGAGLTAYADAIATYLAFTVDKLADLANSLCMWEPMAQCPKHLFGRQAIPMTFDFAEGNVLSDSSGSFIVISEGQSRAMSATFGWYKTGVIATVSQLDAVKNSYLVRPTVVSTDPPYYDNIGYADLSDFFYVWLRSTMKDIWPALFRTITTPKSSELVATPARHGGKSAAEAFFMHGMSMALGSIRTAATEAEPLAIYYAFKQSEAAEDGITSAGWASFLQGVVDSGLLIDGTWPIRTENASRMRGVGSNALASSIVLICRKRSDDALVCTRAEFVRALRRELPEAVVTIRRAGVGPVDMQQSVIGPGMGVFTRHARVLEDDDTSMPVRTALSLINRVWDEIEHEAAEALDSPSQVALAWFAAYGFDARPAGDLISLANAKDLPVDALFGAGVFQDGRGKAALVPRDQLQRGWTPAGDRAIAWLCVQHAIRTLNAPEGGAEAAAVLLAAMGPLAEPARTLVDRLFQIATEKGWAAEALAYNALAEEWPRLLDLTPETQRVSATQAEFIL